MAMNKLIVTAAICGAEVTKEQNPAVPYTKEEMVREAKSAFDAGAAVIHVHVRTDDGTPTQDRERFRVVMDAIKEACPGVILIPSTGGATGMTPEERLQPTELFPEMATLDCGTCNFGDDIFVNDMPTMRAFGKRMLENHIKPEYECFEMGHLDTILKMAQKGLVPGAPMQPASWQPPRSPWAATSVWASRTTSTSPRACWPSPTASWSPRSWTWPSSWAVRSLPPTRPERSLPWPDLHIVSPASDPHPKPASHPAAADRTGTRARRCGRSPNSQTPISNSKPTNSKPIPFPHPNSKPSKSIFPIPNFYSGPLK